MMDERRRSAFCKDIVSLFVVFIGSCSRGTLSRCYLLIGVRMNRKGIYKVVLFNCPTQD